MSNSSIKTKINTKKTSKIKKFHNKITKNTLQVNKTNLKTLQNSDQEIVQNSLKNSQKKDLGLTNNSQNKSKNKLQKSSCQYFSNLREENEIVEQIIEKFQNFPKVTFYGGANVKTDSTDYLQVQKLANSLSKLGFVVASGGGPGIMAAAISGGNGEFEIDFGDSFNNLQKNKIETQNLHNFNSKSISFRTQNSQSLTPTLGLRMNLVSEPPPFLATNDYLFTDFAPRKLALRNSNILIFAPGGFGTLDELMEILTLLKTRKIFNKQVFLYNSNFWRGLLSWICQEIMGTNLAVEEFLQYFVVCDKIDEILKMIKNPDIYKQKCEQNSCFLR